MSTSERPVDKPGFAKDNHEWDMIEKDFWDRFNGKYATEDARAERDWHEANTDIRVEMASLSGRRTMLSETRERLSRELMVIDQEFAGVVKAHNGMAERLNHLESSYRETQQHRLEQRRHMAQDMAQWFRESRREGSRVESGPALTITDKRRLALEQLEPAGEMHKHHRAPDTTRRPLQSGPPAFSHQQNHNRPPEAEALVDIVSHEGAVIGAVRRIEPWNQWVQAIMQLPIKRLVRIRAGRTFNAVHLESIYERVDAKGTKWLSCMIQATGEMQARRCHCCEKDHGTFAECVIVGGSMFPKCANCEWNRQGCHPGVGMSVEMPIREPPRPLEPPIMSSSQVSNTHPMDNRGWAAEESLKAPGYPLPSPRPQPQMVTGFTPTNAASVPVSPLRSAHWSASTSGQGSPFAEEENLEIRPADIVLRHNGQVYTYPPCMEGVPVEKISPGHPYWDPNWDEPMSVIASKLRMWQRKLDEVNAARARGEKTGSAKYQHGRQVARGKTMIYFLRNGEISPYQLLSKGYMSGTRGSITSYDTLYRLCETLDELRKYEVQVHPLDWVRQRLHELIEAQGSAFNLAKTMHDFYNDKKLTAARSKAGFKNIGRPAGMKMGARKRKSPGPPQGGSVRTSSRVRRSCSTDAASSGSHDSQGRGKRQKSMSYPPGGRDGDMDQGVLIEEDDDDMDEELKVEGWSDTDSLTGAGVSRNDFRVYQVRSRLYTSSDKVTQYLAWVDEKQMFEHQVLKETDPVEWGLHREPIDFHFDLDDLFQVVWNRESLRVYLVLSDEQLAATDEKPRGSMMVAFKRDSTKRRFLAFCQKKEIDLVVYPAFKLEDKWEKLKSETLGTDDEEASDELKE